MVRGDQSGGYHYTPASQLPGYSDIRSVTFRGERSDYLGSVPFDALWNVVATMLAGGLKFIHLDGATMKTGPRGSNLSDPMRNSTWIMFDSRLSSVPIAVR